MEPLAERSPAAEPGVEVRVRLHDERARADVAHHDPERERGEHEARRGDADRAHPDARAQPHEEPDPRDRDRRRSLEREVQAETARGPEPEPIQRTLPLW